MPYEITLLLQNLWRAGLLAMYLSCFCKNLLISPLLMSVLPSMLAISFNFRGPEKLPADPGSMYCFSSYCSLGRVFALCCDLERTLCLLFFGVAIHKIPVKPGCASCKRTVRGHSRPLLVFQSWARQNVNEC